MWMTMQAQCASVPPALTMQLPICTKFKLWLYEGFLLAEQLWCFWTEKLPDNQSEWKIPSVEKPSDSEVGDESWSWKTVFMSKARKYY